jgi:hypothetical protein
VPYGVWTLSLTTATGFTTVICVSVWTGVDDGVGIG